MENELNYWISIPAQHKDYLGQIRHWNNLKMATDVSLESNNERALLWVKDFSERQLNSLELKSIPFKKVFVARDGLLFHIGERVPQRKVPSLLWTPIAKALPVELPDGNYNFFGFDEKIAVKLVETEMERPAFGMLAPLANLAAYIETAPALRLAALEWVIIKQHLAFIVGMPLLPIKGFTYWKRGNFLLPTGFEFEFDFLTEALQKALAVGEEDFVLWNKDSSYILLPKSALKPLSIGSFRLSV